MLFHHVTLNMIEVRSLIRYIKIKFIKNVIFKFFVCDVNTKVSKVYNFNTNFFKKKKEKLKIKCAKEHQSINI